MWPRTRLLDIKTLIHTTKMAHSRFEYVKDFETETKLLPDTWTIVRIDGKGFHKFSNVHNFHKPNDFRALELMNKAALCVMQEFRDCVLSYGQSDEYSFVFRKDMLLYNRRSDKILTYVNSLFSSSYVFYWNQFFERVILKYPPSFDARIVLYPSDRTLRDYLSWRQADVHINNLYNTTFWNLVLKGGFTKNGAEKELSGTLSADKNEILFSQFGINYNNEPLMYRKGTILLRKRIKNPFNKRRPNVVVYPLHEDMIQNRFWTNHSEVLDVRNRIPDYEPYDQELPDLVVEQLQNLKEKKKGKQRY